MKKVILGFSFLVLFSYSSLAQDNDHLIEYHKYLGKDINELIIEWGRPLHRDITEYGVQVYSYKKQAVEFDFYIQEDIIIAGQSFLNLSGNGNLAGAFIFYAIFGSKLENIGFEKIESSENPKTDVYSNGIVKITIQLTSEYSDNFYIISSAVFED